MVAPIRSTSRSNGIGALLISSLLLVTLCTHWVGFHKSLCKGCLADMHRRLGNLGMISKLLCEIAQPTTHLLMKSETVTAHLLVQNTAPHHLGQSSVTRLVSVRRQT
jgi:hypothetical protein